MKHRQHREREKPNIIAVSERSLGAGSCMVPDLQLFTHYLRVSVLVADLLTYFYSTTMCNEQDGAATPEVPLHRKLRLSVYINCQQAIQRLVNRL
ncbi:hypothetical protein J3F81_003790 [Coemansia sp. RSA 371]|nr:hypothetical protein J3F81_003790 [Coemansia sp. RSA 371]